MSFETYIPERALFIFAHPDDIEFSCAGTAAFWAAHGSEVSYLVLTDGNVGSHDLGLTQQELAQIRRAEQTAAATIAGAADCYFLGLHDGLLDPSLELRREIVHWVRRLKPNAVVCSDPLLFYRGERPNHPDHRAAGRVVLDAIFPAVEMHLLYPEMAAAGITPHQVNYAYVTTATDHTHFIDISSTIETKIRALHCHKSQLGDRDYSDRIKERAAEVGKKVGLRYAEAFRRLTIKPPA